MTDRLTAAEFNRQKGGEPRRHKYGAKPVVMDGIRFDSQLEARRWGELVTLERAGEITDLRRQVPIPLWGRDDALRTETGLQMRYVADFQYRDTRLGGALVVEDAKGFRPDVYKLKLAILKAQGIEITEVTK